MQRFYYVNRNTKLVKVFNIPWIDEDEHDFEYLGSTDNPKVKMAVAAFLHQEPGYRIEDNTKV